MADLTRWSRALVVVAHPDDESFGLGAVLSTLAERGTRVSVLCFTQGEASTLHGVEGDLSLLRREELRRAADELGLDGVRLLAHPDGALAAEPAEVLLSEARDYAAEVRPDGLLAFDPSGITGHPDHRTATWVAERLAAELDLELLAWTLPAEVCEQLQRELAVPFQGHSADAIDVVVEVDRARQRRAIACHESQAVPGSPLWRRLELLGDREHLRRLRRPASAS